MTYSPADESCKTPLFLQQSPCFRLMLKSRSVTGCCWGSAFHGRHSGARGSPSSLLNLGRAGSGPACTRNDWKLGLFCDNRQRLLGFPPFACLWHGNGHIQPLLMALDSCKSSSEVLGWGAVQQGRHRTNANIHSKQ